MMNVKVTARTITIEIDKAVHVFARHALLGVRLEEFPRIDANPDGSVRLYAEPVRSGGKVSIALAGGVHIEAALLLDEARRLVDLLTQAMEGDDGTHD